MFGCPTHGGLTSLSARAEVIIETRTKVIHGQAGCSTWLVYRIRQSVRIAGAYDRPIGTEQRIGPCSHEKK